MMFFSFIVHVNKVIFLLDLIGIIKFIEVKIIFLFILAQ
jgi:hypothetical protein